MSPSLAGARAVVLGLGHFGGGLGAARWLLRQGADVTVTDRAPEATLAGPVAELAEFGRRLGRSARIVLGGHAGVDFTAADLLVVNPAVPLGAPPVAAAEAAGVAITSEIALLVERWPGRLVGVTGSNGKSTTAALTAAVLDAAGVPVSLGGNVGGSLLDRLERAAPDEVAVLELSSFMLEMLARLRLGPDVAVITNVTPNHLDRHGTFEAYAEAKRSILARARYAVLCADDPLCASWAEDFHGQALLYGARGDMVVDGSGALIDRFGTVLAEPAAIPLPGRAQRLDLAGAVLAGAALMSDEIRAARALPAALERFVPLPHRMERVGEVGDVTWIDDSVSTTPESTAASVAALDRAALLILGGRDKGLSPGGLVEACRGRVRLVLTIGEEGDALARILTQGGILAERVGTVAAAVERAGRLARAGEAVLLSPGYSSHDQFTNFEERGRAFARAVRRLAGGGAGDAEDRGAAAGDRSLNLPRSTSHVPKL